MGYGATAEHGVQEKDLQIRPGERFLDFQSLGLLGRGGVGEVHKIRYRQEVQALKLIRREWVGDPAMCSRTLNEGQILTRINHRNIVKVHDAGMTADNRVWIRMEFLDGPNLRELMRRSGALSLPRVCAFLRAAAHALHQCHLFGVVHRDVKPENFMVVRDEEGSEVLKLLDFGLAKLYGAETMDLGLLGTPQYMAPEQWNKRRKVTAATDLYAVGLMGCEMFEGCHPLFRGGEALSPDQMMHEHIYTKVPSPEVHGMPRVIAKLILKTVRKDPDRRPPDALVWAEKIWGQWRKIRDADPDVDTFPGEPPKDQIVSRPMVASGASPFTRERERSPDVARERLPDVARERLPDVAPLQHTPTVRMVPPPQVPGAAAGRRSLTVRMPDPLRDPSCVAALDGSSGDAATASTALLVSTTHEPLGSTGTVPIVVAPVIAAAAATTVPLGVPLKELTSGVQAIDPRRHAGPVLADAPEALERGSDGRTSRETPLPERISEMPAIPQAAPNPGALRALHHAWSLPVLAALAALLLAALVAVRYASAPAVSLPAAAPLPASTIALLPAPAVTATVSVATTQSTAPQPAPAPSPTSAAVTTAADAPAPSVTARPRAPVRSQPRPSASAAPAASTSSAPASVTAEPRPRLRLPSNSAPRPIQPNL